jgi:hypothetical protein
MNNDLIDIAVFYKADHGGFTIADGVLTFEDGFEPTKKQKDTALLEMAKKRKASEVDQYFSNQRVKILSPGAFMDMIYLLKAQEAKAYLANDPGEYPLLNASVQAGEAADLDEAANTILEKETALRNIAAQMEQQRLAKKIAIKNAKTLAELEAIEV